MYACTYLGVSLSYAENIIEVDIFQCFKGIFIKTMVCIFSIVLPRQHFLMYDGSNIEYIGLFHLWLLNLSSELASLEQIYI